jgi:hypothetical protein
MGRPKQRSGAISAAALPSDSPAGSAPRSRAIVFWWYKQPEVCISRLKLLRQLNPATPIYAVYGGVIESFADWNTSIAPLVDDSWCFTQPKDLEWKWRHGDQILSCWYQERGVELAWESVLIVQWDILILASIETIFGSLKQDQVYLPGLTAIEEIESDWCWVRPDHWEAEVYLSFKEHLGRNHGYTGPWLGCQFITAVFPRRFLELYSAISMPELGFLEYKLPAYAKTFGFELEELTSIEVSWPIGSKKRRRPACSADRWEVGSLTIAWHILRRHGQRLFHPFYRPFPNRKRAIIPFLVRDSLTTEIGGRLRRWKAKLSNRSARY